MSSLANASAVESIPSTLLPTVADLDGMLRTILLGTCIVLLFVLDALHVLCYTDSPPPLRFYGLMGHQTYRYFYLYLNDVALLKVLVCLTNRGIISG